MLFESRIINCSQEETLGNLLSRLEEDKSGSRVGHVTVLKKILSATSVYFVIEQQNIK